jgi:DNA-binding response OmpR family regulator
VALRGLLEEALLSEGFRVSTCESFLDIRAAAAAHQGDVIVADFWGGSQRTLTEAARNEIRELTSLLPLILLTGRSWAASTTAAELGARALIRKPFDLDELLATVGAAFQEEETEPSS